jgi:hypothetical protein
MSEKKETNSKLNEECVELKNIKYQTMLINNNSNNINKTTDQNTIDNIDAFLSNEIKYNEKQPWSKLGEGIKLKKINEYATAYCNKHKSHRKKEAELIKYLKKCMAHKKLQRVKDVEYNIKTGKITKIPGLKWETSKNRFTLKKPDKKGSTLKNLAPIKKKKKIKIKNKKVVIKTSGE